jgi:hypothetical protein
MKLQLEKNLRYNEMILLKRIVAQRRAVLKSVIFNFGLNNIREFLYRLTDYQLFKNRTGLFRGNNLDLYSGCAGFESPPGTLNIIKGFRSLPPSL